MQYEVVVASINALKPSCTLQENIVPAAPAPRIKHPLLNELFNGFSEELQMYIPCADLRKLYEEL